MSKPGQYLLRTDGTCAVAERLASSQPYLRLLRNPGNRGKGYSVRHGMLEAQGEWVLFTDADSLFLLKMVERLVAHTAARLVMLPDPVNLAGASRMGIVTPATTAGLRDLENISAAGEHFREREDRSRAPGVEVRR